MIIIVIDINKHRNDQYGEGNKKNRGRRVDKADGVFALGKKLHNKKTQGNKNKPQRTIIGKQVQKNRQHHIFCNCDPGI